MRLRGGAGGEGGGGVRATILYTASRHAPHGRGAGAAYAPRHDTHRSEAATPAVNGPAPGLPTDKAAPGAWAPARQRYTRAADRGNQPQGRGSRALSAGG